MDTNNKYKKDLDANISILKKCQSDNNVLSCLKCKKIIGCKTRLQYVESVYSSMNKGSGGFFNFEA